MGKTGLMTWGGEELLRHMGVPGPIADLIVGATVGRFGGRAQQPGEQPGPVKIPRPTRSDLNDLDAMVAGGHMTPENYVSEIMGHGYSQNVAQSRLQMAMSKRQGPTMQPAQGPAALGNLPANPSALGDIRTTVPPGVTVGQEPQMNLPRQTGPTTLQQPQPQPATPQDPNQLTLNLQGVPNVQMKLPGTVDVPQPAQEPTQFRLPPEQGNLFNAPVQDPRAAAFAQQLAAARQRALPFGRPDIPGTPLGTQVATTQELPFTERIQRGNNARVIADRAERFGKPIRIVTSERLRTRLQNSLNLDFVPSSSEIREAADILRSRGRSREPTAANP
jgi:hypothetical protein